MNLVRIGRALALRRTGVCCLDDGSCDSTISEDLCNLIPFATWHPEDDCQTAPCQSAFTEPPE